MWCCNLCSLETRRRGNVIRHIREVHGIDDPNAQNPTNYSNTGVKSCEKDKTAKESNGRLSRMMGAGIPLSEERYQSMNSSEQMTDLQDGGYFSELNRRQPV